MEGTVLDPSSFRIIDPYEPEVPEAAGELGRDDFMRLLLTQLQNQDPLNPAKDREFIAQLAQFSSLEQLIQVNDGLSRVEGGQNNLVNAQALGLIGKTVLVDAGSRLRLRGGAADEIVYVLSEPANRATLEILDGSGRPLRTLELADSAAGRWRVTWDGLDDEGNRVPDGEYDYRINAYGAGDATLPVSSFLSLRIDGVSFAGGGVSLVSGEHEIPFLNIIEIRTDETGPVQS